jgi:hypothetical protein
MSSYLFSLIALLSFQTEIAVTVRCVVSAVLEPLCTPQKWTVVEVFNSAWRLVDRTNAEPLEALSPPNIVGIKRMHAELRAWLGAWAWNVNTAISEVSSDLNSTICLSENLQ